MAETRQQDRLSVMVNGEARFAAAGCTIAAMLRDMGIEPQRVAVERNLEVVPRSTLGEAEVRDGDVFELVHFVGGG